ncbi:glycosyltransferase [Hyphomicrobium sp.]|uniref:glycosyltransferase n=1 Tax=Hyphomicrobium sp. TaxID=82 RepID=UPI0025C7108D|nr:glycosyltransferase [Hyphomicrobium sp.]MCC7253464.1 glycosyltransferase [Hyphomicrobium sp.]
MQTRSSSVGDVVADRDLSNGRRDHDAGVSVILSTFAPDLAVLRLVLSAAAVALGRVARSELIIVENGSRDVNDDLLQLVPQAHLIRLADPSLLSARCAGISVAQYNVLVFLDDDTIVRPDYALAALDLAETHPSIGVFGGRILARLEKPIARWKKPALPYLAVRDSELAFKARWGQTTHPDDPVGAGMVLRRVVAERLASYAVANPEAKLGREGDGLAGCEDSAICLLADDLKLGRAYAGKLELEHVIPHWRLNTGYLIRLIRSTGASAARLAYSRGGVSALRRLSLVGLAARLVRDLVRNGPAGYLTWQWSLGYWQTANTIADGRVRRQPNT